MIGAVGFACLAVGAGYFLSYRTHDPHWMNRAGAAIVAAEAIIAIAEYQRRSRLNRVQQFYLSRKRAQILSGESHLDLTRTEEILETEIRRAEFNVLMLAVVIAMLGELLHGFGDLLLEIFHH